MKYITYFLYLVLIGMWFAASTLQAKINLQFAIQSVAPTLTHVKPDNDIVTGGATVQIVGENFQDGATVTIGGNGVSNVIFVSPTELIVEAPAGLAGSADIVVTNPDGKSATLEDGFTYTPLPPAIISITPDSDTTAGGTSVTLVGENFQTDATVHFGGNEAVDVIVTDTRITVTVPAGLAGPVIIVVTNPDGQAAQIGFTYIDPPEFPPYDVNRDGEINIFDLVFTASQFGKTGEGLPGDINEDGMINILDLVAIASHFGEQATPEAPSLARLSTFAKVTKGGIPHRLALEPEANRRLRATLTELDHQADTNSDIRFVADLLRQWLIDSGTIPHETRLYPNYPNPFNPETWIPYQLAEATEVQISIYNVKGQRVRELAVGFRHAGIYSSRSKATHWDGRNDSGELVTSGIYFYTFHAGGFSDTRKMLILK